MPAPLREPEWNECIDGNVHDLTCFIEDDSCEYCGMSLLYFWEGYVAALNKTVAEEADEERARTEATGSRFAEEMYGWESEDGSSTQRPEQSYICMGME